MTRVYVSIAIGMALGTAFWAFVLMLLVAKGLAE